jgi:hypothetical protein
VKSEKINVTLTYGVLRGGVKTKGGVKLSILYGKDSCEKGCITFKNINTIWKDVKIEVTIYTSHFSFVFG